MSNSSNNDFSYNKATCSDKYTGSNHNNNDNNTNNNCYSNYVDSSIYDEYNINSNNTNNNNNNNNNYINDSLQDNNKNIMLNRENKTLVTKKNNNKIIDHNGFQSSNSRFGPYTSESNCSPSLTSFGHRPISASRTFHPCTMRIRLRHDEIVKTTKKKRKTGFGLSPMVLEKLLHAPKLRNYDDKTSINFFTENQSNPYDHPDTISRNRDELFLSSRDMIDFGISKER